MLRIKVTLLLILIGTTANSQFKKISSLSIEHFSNRIFAAKKNDIFNKFEVRNNFLYFSSEGKIHKLNFFGEIIDSVEIICNDSLPCNCFEFEVAEKDKSNDVQLYYSNEYDKSINITQGLKKKRIALKQVWGIQGDTTHCDFYGFSIDEKKNIYIRHSGLYGNEDSNHDSYLTIIKNDTTITRKLPPRSFQVNFKVYDSIAAFLTVRLEGSRLFFMNLNTFDSIRFINISEKLGLKYSLNRLIFFDDRKCIFVASRFNSNIDYIIQVDLNTFKFEKILQIGSIIYDKKYFKTHKVKRSKESESGSGWFIYQEYPNRRMYSYDKEKLFVLYELKGAMYIDTYKLFE